LDKKKPLPEALFMLRKRLFPAYPFWDDTSIAHLVFAVIRAESAIFLPLFCRHLVTSDFQTGSKSPARNPPPRWEQTTGGWTEWKWPDLSDITYIPTGKGWLYLAIVKDLCTRKIVEYAFSNRIDTQLTLAALEMAYHRRRPAKGLIFHSDRGAQ